jgi:hypothetical protein
VRTERRLSSGFPSDAFCLADFQFQRRYVQVLSIVFNFLSVKTHSSEAYTTIVNIFGDGLAYSAVVASAARSFPPTLPFLAPIALRALRDRFKGIHGLDRALPVS